jgi:hypothetical protein
MKDFVNGGLAPEFEFDFQLVFPPALFEDQEIFDALKEAGIEQEGRTNRMPGFRHCAARIAFAEAADRVKEALWNAGWGLRSDCGHAEDEDGANRVERLSRRIRDMIAAVRAGKISQRSMRFGVLQIHFFEAERMKGRAIDPAAIRACDDCETSPAATLRSLGMWEAQALIHRADVLRDRA